MSETPRVLVISHTVFSKTGNMGKTMADMLSCVAPDHLAQIYFHSEVPTVSCCRRYFRITDRDILKSLVRRKPVFRVFGETDIRHDRKTSRTDTGLTARIYQFARRRTPLIYGMRNLIWSLGVWDSEALDGWIREFQPDVIFFASGDYSFAYKIVCRLAQRYELPVVMWCCDDYYLGKKKTRSPLYHYVHADRVKWAKKTGSLCSHIITICDKMKRDYPALFDAPIDVIRISAEENPDRLPAEQRQGIVYAGNLGVNRIVPLLELGRALKASGRPGYDRIDVYSGERDPKKLEQLTEKNGIRFHGAVPSEQIPKILGSTKFLLHLEASDERSVLRTRYSLSTKIGESLQSGACILAHGPEDLSSMEYLAENQAAVFVRQPEDAAGIVEKLLSEQILYDSCVENAVLLARKAHNKQKNDELMLQILTEAVKGHNAN